MKTAPEGATHYSPRDECFYQKRDGSWYPLVSGIPTDLSVYASRAFLAQLIPVDSVAPAWDGSGLPPVGVECEAPAGDITSMPSGECEAIWSRVKVIAHDEGLVVFRWLGGEMKGQYAFYKDAESFRPLKTPEQMAAEQRERAIQEMIDACGWMLSHPCACQLYDAGYRKVSDDQ